MVLTKRELRKWLDCSFLSISKEKEKEILNMFGTEPGDGYTWSEQDIYEQLRKMIQ